MTLESSIDFNGVFRGEIIVVNERRARDKDHPRPEVVLVDEQRDSTGEPVLVPREDAGLVGLALSGGGVRSAAFCLGALQALDGAGVLQRVDYLSTVSGGGYIGSSLSAALESTKGDFPFKVDAFEDETPSMQHIRDFSNYLFPNGAADFPSNAAICVRGLVANAVVVLPILLGAAILTILSYRPAATQFSNQLDPNIPNIFGLRIPNIFGLHIPNVFGLPYFVVTTYLILFVLAITLIWGLVRSRPRLQRANDAPSLAAAAAGWAGVAVVVAAFCELQPFVLDAMLYPGQAKATFGWISQWINTITATLAPLAAVTGFLASKLGELVKSATESTKPRAWIAGIAAKAAIYLAALVVPFLLWVVYLDFAYWGICLQFNPSESTCPNPWWLSNASDFVQGPIWLYLAVLAALFFMTLLLRPNANSLHPLYRDRLGKAFLFEPKDRLAKEKGLAEFLPRLSDLSGRHGPYHLINAALNIQNSKTANKRGRNADFFLFSPKFVGSETTGYVTTEEMQRVANGLDLRTAMAISGAAASSNMGAQSIKPLTPTLTLLNIRLGYWLRNPSRVAGSKTASWNPWANYYFLAELLGRLNEKRKSVYLTDGGHIENLGLYELLKRNCHVIIVIDAEADREMAFGSFNTLVRYARIDLGLEIDLPWQQITDVTRATGECIDKQGNTPKKHGPHCAIGRITYPGPNKSTRTGVLVYIKSSLTGDENDYVFHYKKRYSAFPHETTLDQMFSEEQFEAYRALGYHATNGFFDRRDDFAKTDPDEFPGAETALREDVMFLDGLFPRARSGTAGDKQKFADWLPPPLIY